MPKKSKFNLSHGRTLSLEAGNLIPIFHEEVFPGDKFRVNTEMMMRLAPMLAPVMHRMNVEVHYWFVPWRLVWKEWADHITGGRDGDLNPVKPHIFFPYQADLSTSVDGSLADYLGLPTVPETGATVTNTYKISSLPFRAYQLIYNENYRDPNLSDPVAFSLDSGLETSVNAANILQLRKSAWEKDYFTSALPYAQRGGAASAPVEYAPGVASKTVYGGGAQDGNPIAGALTGEAVTGDLQAVGVDARLETEAYVDVQELRKAEYTERWLEKSMRGGYRLIEMILKHFGVKSSDARLQRPEFLGGSKSPVVISEVLSNFQFSGDAEGLPQGNMAGHGISAGSNPGFKRFFEEHGCVIGLMRVLPRTAYCQGIRPMWERFDKFDYPWPTFASLGEQVVKSSEIYADFAAPANTPASDWGYQERYADIKWGFNSVHGNFRSNLAYWECSRRFTSQPNLNEAFVTADPTTRIFAVEDDGALNGTHHYYCQIWHDCQAVRPFPFHSVPGIR